MSVTRGQYTNYMRKHKYEGEEYVRFKDVKFICDSLAHMVDARRYPKEISLMSLILEIQLLRREIENV